MDKLTIGIIQPTGNQPENEELHEILTSPTMHEMYSMVNYENLQQAIDDNEVEAIVLKSHRDELPALPQQGHTLLVSDNIRIALANESDTMEQIQLLVAILERDFDYLTPRIALLGEATEELIQQANEKQICLYAPYTIEKLLEEECYLHFDGVLALKQEDATTLFKQSRAQYRFSYYAGQEEPIAKPYSSAPTDLTNAMYTVMDICRNRETYDVARENPLPKLYHERREEKPRPAGFEKPKPEA